MSIGALLLTAPLMYAQYYTNYFMLQVDAKNVFGSTIMSAWLGWWITVDGQRIVSATPSYGGKSYYFLDSVSLGLPVITTSCDKLVAVLPVTFKESLGPFTIQTIDLNLFNIIEYYGGNSVEVHYGYNNNEYVDTFNLPISIIKSFSI